MALSHDLMIYIILQYRYQAGTAKKIINCLLFDFHRVFKQCSILPTHRYSVLGVLEYVV